MVLRVTRGANILTVQSGTVGNPGRDKFKTDSAFWIELKKCLNAEYGMDLVKKVMNKDGCMVGIDNGQYYLRDRKHKFCIYDADYAVRDLVESFNSTGVVNLYIRHL